MSTQLGYARMAETSVLLDFARDDTWIPREVAVESVPSQQLKEDAKISARIEFLKYIAAVEHQHLGEGRPASRSAPGSLWRIAPFSRG